MSATTYLTFNKSCGDAAPLDELAEDVPLDVNTALPLQHTWHLWEQVVPSAQTNDYSENTKALAKFDTVQKFWQLWYHMPQPSELLNQKRMVREGVDGEQHLVDALMIFREGIKPMWEDVANALGGHFEYRIRPGQYSPSQIDEYWNNLVLSLIGGTVDPLGLITGVRLVDKLSNPRVGCLRIEVWYTGPTEQPIVDELLKNVNKCIASKLDGSQGSAPRGDIKPHSNHYNR